MGGDGVAVGGALVGDAVATAVAVAVGATLGVGSSGVGEAEGGGGEAVGGALAQAATVMARRAAMRSRAVVICYDPVEMLGRPTSTGPCGPVCTAVANKQAEPTWVERPAQIDAWLAELGLTPVERAEREGATSWDVVLDGRRRRGVRVTLILDPDVALVAWVHFGPPLSDNFRKTYRQLLRWNDELPFAKFALSEDERPVLTAEVPAAGLTRDVVGMLLARVLAICDLVHEPVLALMGELRRRDAALAAAGERDPAGERLLDRYAAELSELV